jgi:energy-coupling factor transporter ATP-binding protein EcfA2
MIIGTTEETTKNLIIIGPKGSGKSSIFSLLTSGSPNNYSDNGTCGINFGFMRSQNSVKKKVMNVFEIGSDLENIILINTILNNENFEFTTLLIILDFDNPQSQLNYLIKCVTYLRKLFNKSIDPNIIDSNIKNKISSYPSGARPSQVDVFPLETYVIGNKYDILEKIDLEKLKWLCPSLRYFCYINSLSLIFYSSKKKETINALYNTMVENAFGSGKKENLKKYLQKNSTKALYINFYDDNLASIGEPKIPVTVTGNLEQRWKETYDGLWKNYKKSEKNNTNINLDQNYFSQFQESKIDHELKLFNEYKDSNEKDKYVNIRKKKGTYAKDKKGE